MQAVTTAHPQIAAAEHLAQQFRQVLKDRNSNALNTWLNTSLELQIPELKPFVAGVQRDYEAVIAAVEQVWSNGQVEGQVRRLKLLKRQMYSRGGFLLLRRRVLPLSTSVLSALHDVTKSAEDPFYDRRRHPANASAFLQTGRSGAGEVERGLRYAYVIFHKIFFGSRRIALIVLSGPEFEKTADIRFGISTKMDQLVGILP